MAVYDTSGVFKGIALLLNIVGNLLQPSALTFNCLIYSGKVACDDGLVVRVSDPASSFTSSHFIN